MCMFVFVCAVVRRTHVQTGRHVTNIFVKSLGSPTFLKRCRVVCPKPSKNTYINLKYYEQKLLVSNGCMHVTFNLIIYTPHTVRINGVVPVYFCKSLVITRVDIVTRLFIYCKSLRCKALLLLPSFVYCNDAY